MPTQRRLLLAVNVLRLSIQGMGYSRLSLISGLLEMLARTVGEPLGRARVRF